MDDAEKAAMAKIVNEMFPSGNKQERSFNMEDIGKIRLAVIVFLKNTLNVTDVTIIKIAKAEDGWNAEAEVYEESSFIKALGLQTKVRDRNFYEVKLSDSLQIQSYERKSV